MTRRYFVGIYIVSLLVILGTSLIQSVPGYMDAEYYLVIGQRLADGQTWQEPFLWNYLDQPAGIPHAANTYWMPLTSFLAAVGMLLAGRLDFFAARLPFMVLAACLAPLTAWMAYRIHADWREARLAGILALFPGFYLAYYSITDNFVVYMLLGAAFLVAAFPEKFRLGPYPHAAARPALLGVLAGLMHLSRADGVLWLLAAMTLVSWPWPARKKFSDLAGCLAVCLAGYGLVMLPWFLRNFQVYGAILSPASAHALWITSYDQTFAYPASGLNFQNWLALGWQQHLLDRLSALSANLKNLLAVEGSIFLLPFMLVGMWKKRNDVRVQFVAILWLVTFLIMTVIFPYAGGRGSFLHSGAAFQVLLWALVPYGLTLVVQWVAPRRNWNVPQATQVFGIGLVLLAAGYTALSYTSVVIGQDVHQPAWQAGWESARLAGGLLQEAGVDPEAIIMVNNPPGFYLATGRPGLVIPDGGEETLLAAAHHYGASYLILDQNYVQGLEELFRAPGDRPGLDYLGGRQDIYLFRILPPVDGAGQENSQ
ncbi:MAG: hypothetical protein VB089_19700 [Anaerolineaceae bacterium]|nr:hypothetical protein [Anaerolineaceae bacterium]